MAARAALFCEGIFLDHIDTAIWISVVDAAKKVGVSPTKIQRQGVPWQESSEPNRIRYKLAVDNGAVVQRYYQPDVRAAFSGQETSTRPTADEIGSSLPGQENPIGATSAEVPEIPKPPSRPFQWAAPGIYRYLKEGTLYERPWINGRRTWRSLGTTDLQTAQCEFRRRRGLPLESGCGDRLLMKAVLEFNLPEAQESFEASANGLEWKSVVLELDRQLCVWIKERQHFASSAKALRILRQQLQQRLAEKGLRIA
jgi:hypothetical protein